MVNYSVFNNSTIFLYHFFFYFVCVIYKIANSNQLSESPCDYILLYLLHIRHFHYYYSYNVNV